MLIGIDLDEVLADFTGAFVKYYNDSYGTNLTREQFFTLEYGKVLNLNSEETHKRITEFGNSEYFLEIQPVRDSIEGINFLSQGNKIVVVTARNEELYGRFIYGKSRSWVDKYFEDKFSDVFFAHNPYFGDKMPKTKADICSELGINLMIDDSPRFVEDISSKSNGTSVFLFDCPWNQSSDLNKNITRVYGWKEIVNKIENEYE